jgi:predicted restriction endonuclease
LEDAMGAEQELDEVLTENYQHVGHATGYWGNYFVRDLRTIGGVATVKRLLKPKRNDAIARGLQTLFDYGLEDISVERTALDKRFRALFTSAELQEAQRRLNGFRAQLRHKPTSPIEEVIRDPVRREMLVEAFERKARWARLARSLYGYECMIPGCRFVLIKENGDKYIEVHHIIPMFDGGSPNDKVNLSVLCPNHHREIHFAAESRRESLTTLVRKEQKKRLVLAGR